MVLFMAAKSTKSSSTRQKEVIQKLGKAQARQQFAPLVEALAAHGGVVEITDYGKTAAVMLGYTDYMRLRAQAAEPSKPSRQLAGSMTIVGDLEESIKEVRKTFEESLERRRRRI